MKHNKTITWLASLSTFLIIPSSITIFTSCANSQPTTPINATAPTINGVSYSNLSGYTGQKFSTNITVDPTITNGKGLPNNLVSIICATRALSSNEYTYNLNADKVHATLEIPGEYVKGNITINFNLTDIQYTVKFNLNGGTGDLPEDQRFSYDDNLLVDEPYTIPVCAGYDFDGWYANNIELYDFSKPVHSDLVLYAHYVNEPQYAITATKDDQEPINFNSLEEFRDKVNSGENDFDGWLVKINKNIDLKNAEWTPIGTSTHPFKGTFDGSNKFIYNYKVIENAAEPDESVKTLGGGLFGYIEGEITSFDHTTPLTQFYNEETYEVNAPKEDKFSCVIKNIKLRGVTTSDHGVENDEDYTAALVSSIKNAYISNIRLDYSNITAANKVGGIAGIVVNQGVALFDKLVTIKNVTINGKGNHTAGIYSRVYGTNERVFALNCQNNAIVTGEGTNTGGITGQSKNTLFYNCTNKGNIKGKARTAGIGVDIQQSVFIGCNNNGNVSQTNLLPDTTSAEQNAPGGIASYGSQMSITMYKCKNTGTIGSEGNEKNTAGIISTGITENSKIKECENNGIILSTRAYDICELSSVPTYKHETSLEDLNQHFGFNKYVIANNIVLTSNDKTLKPTTQLEKIELNNSSGNLTLDLTNATTVTNGLALYVNNCNIDIINGDVSKSISIYGSNNHINVNCLLNNVNINNNSNNESTIVVFNSNINKITLSGIGKVRCTISKDVTADRVAFNEGGDYTLINNGTISHKTAAAANEHTVSTIKSCTITIYNYGRIEALENNSGICSYSLLFYNGANVTLYADDESCIMCDQSSILAVNPNSNAQIFYKENAKLIKNKTESIPYTNLAGENVQVNPWIN